MFIDAQTFTNNMHLFIAAIIENLTEYKQDLSKDMKPLIHWILRKLKSKPHFHDNKLYASEILSILLQNSDENRNLMSQLDGIDILLRIASVSFMVLMN